MSTKTNKTEHKSNKKHVAVANDKDSKPLKSHKKALKTSCFILLVFLMLVSAISSIYSIYKVQSLQRIITEELANKPKEEITNEPLIEQDPKEEASEKEQEDISLSISNAMIEDLEVGRCSTMADAEQHGLLSLEVTIQNNTERDLVLLSHKALWTLLNNNEKVDQNDSRGQLSSQLNGCNDILVDYRYPTPDSNNSSDYYANDSLWITLGGLSIHWNSLYYRGLVLMSGESTTIPLYFKVPRNIDINNFSLEYEDADGSKVVKPFKIALETKSYYESTHNK